MSTTETTDRRAVAGEPIPPWADRELRLERRLDVALAELTEARADLGAVRAAQLGLRDAAVCALADARAEAARHAGRLIVVCEERDVAYAQRDLWQAIVSQAARRTLRGRIGSWLRGKPGR